MKQYIKLLEKILKKGVEKESGRANMPNTWGIEYGKITMDLSKGFPLLTTKKVFWKGIIHELLWFLRGETNIKYLVDNGVNIWNGDAYRWYLKTMKDINQDPHFKTQEDFIDAIKNAVDGYVGEDGHYKLGDLGKVYGYQWRNQNGVDQVQEVIDGLKTNPYSRYHIIDAWNKSDFRDMALPPCHLLYHFIVKPMTAAQRFSTLTVAQGNQIPYGTKYQQANEEEKHKYLDSVGAPKFYLNLNMYQRSCDTFLGVPFNIASMSLLLMIIAKVSNMVPGKARWIGGDVHLYMDHIPVVKDQIARNPKTLPKMVIKKDIITLSDITALTIDDFELQNYDPDDKLYGELFTGNKKD